MIKTNHSIGKQHSFWAACMLAFAFMLTQSDKAVAQWVTNGNNINNTNTGNVGIGTTTPNTNLHVLLTPTTNVITKQTNLNGFLLLSGWGDLTAKTGFVGSFATAPGISSGVILGREGLLWGTYVAFHTHGDHANALDELAERMRISANGNVGIGTNAPLGPLSVGDSAAGNSDGYLVLGKSNGGGGSRHFRIGFDSAFNFVIGDYGNSNTAGPWLSPFAINWQAPSNSLYINSAGRIGIGTNTPATKLHVSGEILSEGPVASNSFRDRTSGRGWAWYGTGDVARFWNSGAGDMLGITASGSMGIGTTAPSSKLHVVGDLTLTGTGNISASGTMTAGNIVARYQDIAEWVPARHAIPAGTVVVLDTEQSNQVLPSSQSYDTRVAGVISARPGVILGEGGVGKVIVATTGRVRVKVDATRAPVRVGDLLVTSDKEGIAMRSEPLNLGGTPIHRPGTLIGKALEPLDKGVGEILVLLSLQ